jgi:DNA polymerase
MNSRSEWIEDGSPFSPVWLVGEAPGADEIESGHPFSGASGYELGKMLAEAGLSRSDCFCTNVCHERPPSYRNSHGKWIHNDINQFFATKSAAACEHLLCVAGRYPRPPIIAGLAHLYELVGRYRPTLIIALGNTPLWALTGVTGITKWRGSILDTEHGKVIPTFHPADVLRAWTHRPIVVRDFRRCAVEAQFPEVRKPEWEFTVAPSLDTIIDWFHTYARASDAPLVCDTEGWGRVDCIGFACDSTRAICIPFTRQTDAASPHIWSAEDEYTVTQACRTVLSARPIIFHNAIWDCQVIARRWALIPRLHADTQVAQHVAFPGLLGGKIDPVTGHVDKKGSSLSLSFIASMYCQFYRYWKDDGRTFDPSIHDERQYWHYNCEDCARTWECAEVLLGAEGVIDQLHLRDQFDFEMRLFGPVLRMMFRGIRYDRAAAARAHATLIAAQRDCKSWLDTATATNFNPDSTPQMRALFYHDLALPQLFNRSTHAPTLDDAALDTIARRTPLLRPLVSQIQNYRTADTLRASLAHRISDDERLRCAINVAFVETMRFSTNETAFGEGSNLQNIKRPDND